MSSKPYSQYGIQSTAGAVPVRNEKGEISMQKVKVNRYISGKKPEYAQYESSDDESGDDDFIDRRAQRNFANRGDDGDSYRFGGINDRNERHRENDNNVDEELASDPRIRRLMEARQNDDEYDDQDIERARLERRRRIHEPEILESEEEEEEEEKKSENKDDNMQLSDDDDELTNVQRRRIELDSDGASGTELSDTEIEKRRQHIRQKLLQQHKEEEILQKEEENKSESSESDSSEYEEETDSEEEENEPRLKPLFVRKKDRATIAEKEKEAQKQKQLELEAKRLAKERRRQTLRLVEESVKKDLEKPKNEGNEADINDVCTEDENDEVEYEAWKLRELKRIKRDRDEKEQREREANEIDRLRNMTEEERKQELRSNPREVTNKAVKGKYKFLQKYYHRGAFYLDEDDEVYKRDFAQATLEDHFDKTILPKVMQVKNFGRCGRTKYTHLVDQDTTQFDSPWYSDTTSNVKFHNEKAGGMKPIFDRPSSSKRKKM